MGKKVQFRFKRRENAPEIPNADGELVGFEATVNVAGWPNPQVIPFPLDATEFGNFLGDAGADNGTLELSLVDDNGNKSEVPLKKTFSLPDTIPPGTPDDIFDVDITGEEAVTPPEPV